jgi:hypothetical protein
MFRKLLVVGAGMLAMSAQTATAAVYSIDTANASNGIYDLYSATFDGALSPCGGGSPSYCGFFSGDPPVGRAITISPNPSGVTTGVPVGISPVPTAGSFLDLTLSGGNTSMSIAGGTIIFPVLSLVIAGAPPTVITATGAGMVFTGLGSPSSTSVDGGGVAELLSSAAPSLAVDFSTLSTAVTSCSGPLCALVGILSLDIVRYRLLIDWDPTFTAFTANFIGQTANNSLLYATLNSTAAIPVPAAVWLAGSALGLMGFMRRRAAA